MLFNSIEFVVFFLLLTAVFYAVQHRWRWPLLLLASCYFYMVFVPEYILILFLLILIDYTAGLLIERSSGARRTWLLVASLASNVGLLGFFKYYDFGAKQVTEILGLFGYHPQWGKLNLLLPIGLSFHTFQSMSYTIEVYRGHQKAERHLGIYALYVLFFAQMVAGPIERPQNLLGQFRKSVLFNYEDVTSGLRLMLWGFFKKMVIADNLARIVDTAYGMPAEYSGWPLVLATYAFALQIFADFSGYSDIARGAARVLGYRLMLNFNMPYQARSISDFWRRWHISLSTWFRDYVYIPLGGSQGSATRTGLNLCTVFLISGLWHGASWGYVLWGGLHGFYLVVGHATKRIRERVCESVGLSRFPRVHAVLAVVVTFHLVLISWVLFRSGGVGLARKVFSLMLHGHTGYAIPFGSWPLDKFHLWGVCLALIAMEAAHLIHRWRSLPHLIDGLPLVVRGGMYGTVFLAIVLWGRLDAHSFIYFQF